MTDLAAIIAHNALRYPHRKAIVFRHRSVNYHQLHQRIELVAKYLISDVKIKSQEKIGLLLKNCPEFIIGYFAVIKAGGIVVPLNIFLTGEELNYIIHDGELTTLITSSEFYPLVEQLLVKNTELRVIFTDKKYKDYLYFSDFYRNKTKVCAFPILDNKETAVILYTSGTTGHPKGVMLSHDNLISNVVSCTKAVEVNAQDKFIAFLPMFHSFTFTVCVLLPLFIGARIVILPSVRPFHRLLRSLVIDRVTIFVAIPLVYELLAKSKFPGFLFRLLPLRLCISGGAPLAGEVLSRFEKKFMVPLLEGYGLTEASPVVSFNPLDDISHPGSVGLALPGITVKIVDEQRKELPIGEIGEIIVKGPNVMQGYYKAPELTREVLEDGWLYTGDVGKINPYGYIYIVDRKKDMILVHGMNVYPREVEEVLLTNLKICEVAIVGKKDAHRGEIPIAFVVLKPDTSLTAKEIVKFCQDKLASYKIPHIFKFCSTLPKTGTGKISKKSLRELLQR